MVLARIDNVFVGFIKHEKSMNVIMHKQIHIINHVGVTFLPYIPIAEVRGFTAVLVTNATAHVITARVRLYCQFLMSH